MTINGAENLRSSYDLQKLLLHLSRETLTREQRETVSGLILTDLELAEVTRHCVERLVAPIAIGHLTEFWGGRNEDLDSQWREIERQSLMLSMLFASEMLEFHKACIEDVAQNHLYFKGPSLAVKYYTRPHARLCRDVDILVPERDLSEVVDAALANGYHIENEDYSMVRHRGKEALSAYVDMSDVVFLRSPRGIAFEIHGSLDRKSGLFDPQLLFRNSKDIDFFHHAIRVIDDELLFCYVAYHATNHTWSRLNWFADAHAILSSKGFNRETCRGWARKLGIADLVDATIEIDDWCSSGTNSSAPPGDGAKQLFHLFVANIEGGLDAEFAIKTASKRRGLPDRFQASGYARIRAYLNYLRLNVFSPNFLLYCRFPLSRRFWWLYTFIRPAEIATRKLGNLFGRLRGGYRAD